MIRERGKDDEVVAEIERRKGILIQWKDWEESGRATFGLTEALMWQQEVEEKRRNETRRERRGEIGLVAGVRESQKFGGIGYPFSSLKNNV